MSLRIKLILITTAVVTVLFGISELLSYQHTAALLDQHEAILVETADHTVALQKLRATRDRMFFNVTTVRVLNAAVTLLVAVAILNYVWYRIIYRPIRRLLSQINIMSRGTWESALPVKRNDEIGELTAAFNHLGQQLHASFESINTSSKLSALALVGGRLVREITGLRGQLAASTRSFESQTTTGVATGLMIVDAVGEQLKALEARFQTDFDRQLAAMSAEYDGADRRSGAKAAFAGRIAQRAP